MKEMEAKEGIIKIVPVTFEELTNGVRNVMFSNVNLDNRIIIGKVTSFTIDSANVKDGSGMGFGNVPMSDLMRLVVEYKEASYGVTSKLIHETKRLPLDEYQWKWVLMENNSSQPIKFHALRIGRFNMDKNPAIIARIEIPTEKIEIYTARDLEVAFCMGLLNQEKLTVDQLQVQCKHSKFKMIKEFIDKTHEPS